jgi:hypothetical protein
VFAEEIMGEFILGLDLLRAYDVFIDLGHHVLHVTRSGRGITMKPAGTTLLIQSYIGQRPGDTSTMQKSADSTARESPGSTSGPVEPSLETHAPKGLYIARTLIRGQWEVPVRVLNVTLQDLVLTRGCPLGHCEPVTLVTQLNAVELQVQQIAGLYEHLQDVIISAGLNLSNAET